VEQGAWQGIPGIINGINQGAWQGHPMIVYIVIGGTWKSVYTFYIMDFLLGWKEMVGLFINISNSWKSTV
jgi:hypothetical protein